MIVITEIYKNQIYYDSDDMKFDTPTNCGIAEKYADRDKSAKINHTDISKYNNNYMKATPRRKYGN